MYTEGGEEQIKTLPLYKVLAKFVCQHTDIIRSDTVARVSMLLGIRTEEQIDNLFHHDIMADYTFVNESVICTLPYSMRIFVAYDKLERIGLGKNNKAYPVLNVKKDVVELVVHITEYRMTEERKYRFSDMENWPEWLSSNSLVMLGAYRDCVWNFDYRKSSGYRLQSIYCNRELFSAQTMCGVLLQGMCTRVVSESEAYQYWMALSSGKQDLLSKYIDIMTLGELKLSTGVLVPPEDILTLKHIYDVDAKVIPVMEIREDKNFVDESYLKGGVI